MPTNPYFNHFQNTAEQNLHQDLIIESIKNFGIDVYYLPRTLVNLDNLYLEDTISSFSNAHLIEMYVKSVEGFEGDGDFISRFGLEIRDQVTFSVARRRWDNLEILDYVRPKEGDLIFFPLNKKLYEIKFVEHESVFYQFGKLPIYDLTCELFQYDDQAIDTGIDDIDSIEERYSYTLEYKYAIGNTAIISPVLTDYSITRVNFIDKGSGYFSIPNISISDPDLSPTAAQLTPVINNKSLQELTVTNYGVYYTENPIITISSPGDSVNATATSNITSNAVSEVEIVNSGSFYNVAPIITVDQPTAPYVTATAVASLSTNTISGISYISSITMNEVGTYYTDVPNVTIEDTISLPDNWTTDSKFGNYSYQLGKSDNSDFNLKLFRSDYDSSLNYGGSFSFWFKYDQNLHVDSGISDVNIFEFKNNSFTQSVISIFDNTGVIKFTTYDTSLTSYHFPTCPSTSILDGNWHFLQFIKSRNGFSSSNLKIIVDGSEIVNYLAPFNGVWTEEWFTNYNTSSGDGGIVIKNATSKGFLIDDIYYDGVNFSTLSIPNTTRSYHIDDVDNYRINYEGFDKKEVSLTPVVSNGRITSMIINDSGEYYATVPAITIETSTGTKVDFTSQVVATINDGYVDTMTIVDSGDFYQSIPNISIESPTGTYDDFSNINATATATYNSDKGIIDNITITNPGKFYYTTPTVTVSDPTGIAQDYRASMTASLNADGSIKSIDIDDRGYGYSITPTITIDAPLSGISKGDVVIGNDSNVKGEVSLRDSTKIQIINSGGSFNDNEFIKTSTGHGLRVYDQSDDQNFITDNMAQNQEIEKEADSIIDFSETNPFSESNY